MSNYPLSEMTQKITDSTDMARLRVATSSAIYAPTGAYTISLVLNSQTYTASYTVSNGTTTPSMVWDQLTTTINAWNTAPVEVLSTDLSGDRVLHVKNFGVSGGFVLTASGGMNLISYRSDPITWADNSGTRTHVPTSGARTTGWSAGDRPTHQVWNWAWNSMMNNIRFVMTRVEELVSKFSVPPLGSVVAFAGKEVAIPSGWMKCEGQTLLVADYPLLYDVLGVFHGGVAGTNFKLPNMVANFIMGANNEVGAEYTSLGDTGGEDTTTIDSTALAHNHSVTGAVFQVGGADSAATAVGAVTGFSTIQKTNLPPYVVLYYIIRVS